jgi:hypothetical protein
MRGDHASRAGLPPRRSVVVPGRGRLQGRVVTGVPSAAQGAVRRGRRPIGSAAAAAAAGRVVGGGHVLLRLPVGHLRGAHLGGLGGGGGSSTGSPEGHGPRTGGGLLLGVVLLGMVLGLMLVLVLLLLLLVLVLEELAAVAEPLPVRVILGRVLLDLERHVVHGLAAVGPGVGHLEGVLLGVVDVVVVGRRDGRDLEPVLVDLSRVAAVLARQPDV